MTSSPRRVWTLKISTLLALVGSYGCHPPTGDPGPGDAPASTVQTWMSGVEVRDAVTGLTVVLGEIAAELTNDDLVALLQPCHGFEADASPAPRGAE